MVVFVVEVIVRVVVGEMVGGDEWWCVECGCDEWL